MWYLTARGSNFLLSGCGLLGSGFSGSFRSFNLRCQRIDPRLALNGVIKPFIHDSHLLVSISSVKIGLELREGRLCLRQCCLNNACTIGTFSVWALTACRQLNLGCKWNCGHANWLSLFHLSLSDLFYLCTKTTKHSLVSVRTCAAAARSSATITSGSVSTDPLPPPTEALRDGGAGGGSSSLLSSPSDGGIGARLGEPMIGRAGGGGFIRAFITNQPRKL